MIGKVVALFLLFAVPAFGLPLRAGSLDFESMFAGNGPVYLEGRGFTFDGFAFNARLDAVDCAFPCSPGETVSLSAAACCNDLPGVAIFRGVEFVDVGSLLGPNQMEFAITGRMKLPRLRPGEVQTETARGRFVGYFRHAEVPLAEPVVERLTADVVVIVLLSRFDDAWLVRALTYDIVRRR